MMELYESFAGMPVIGKVDGFVVGEGMIEYGHSSNIKISGDCIV